MKLERRTGWGQILGFVGVLLAVFALRMGGQAKLSPMLLTAVGVFFALTGWIWLRTEKRWLSTVSTLLWVAAGGVAEVYLSQWLMEASVQGLSGTMERPLCGALLIAAAGLSLFVVLGNLRWSAVIAMTLLMLLTTANSFIYTFRGNELIPADFRSIQTAINVAGSYEYHITPQMVRSWMLLAVLCWTALLLPHHTKSTAKEPHKREKTGWKGFIFALLPRILAAAAAVGIFTGVMQYGTNRANIKIKHFQREGTDYNGYLLNFYLRFPEMFPEKPKNYSLKRIQALEEQMQSEGGTMDSGRRPTIVVIMDESFCDLSVRNPDGVLNTNQAPIPYIRSLRENAVAGYAFASVYGGNTPNSEYEFLTGHSMAWSPFGTIAFQNDVQPGDASLVSTLKGLGYTCTAMHPYLANGWKRPVVYPALGFEESLFLDEFQQAELVRDYVSDKALFDRIIEQFESNRTQPQLIYTVSMQNHGGYQYEGDDFEVNVHTEGYKGNTVKADQYLTLIHKTDEAVEYLLDYFSQQEEEVVVVFFGDHQPYLGEKFYNQLHGGALETLDEQMLQYQVPFFVWTNYDTEEQYVERTSLNYLSVYLMEAAGLPLSPYQRFLQELREVVPAVNQLGYYSLSEGRFLELSQAEEEEKAALSDYAVLQYNALHDRKHLSEGFWGIRE